MIKRVHPLIIVLMVLWVISTVVKFSISCTLPYYVVVCFIDRSLSLIILLSIYKYDREVYKESKLLYLGLGAYIILMWLMDIVEVLDYIYKH